jgi:hypothetical protein
MPLPAPDFERLFAPGTRHTLSGGGTVTIRLRTGTELSLPSGRVVAGEPFMFGGAEHSSGFVQRVSPGRYPLVLILGVFGEDPDAPDAHATIAAARLVIRDEPVLSWEMAVYEGQDPAGLGEDEFFGYPVDGGTGGFVDAQNVAQRRADRGWASSSWARRNVPEGQGSITARMKRTSSALSFAYECGRSPRNTAASPSATSVRSSPANRHSRPDSTVMISRVPEVCASLSRRSPGRSSHRHSSTDGRGSLPASSVPVPPEGRGRAGWPAPPRPGRGG